MAFYTPYPGETGSLWEWFDHIHYKLADWAFGLGLQPEDLTIKIDVWGHYDASYPKFYLYSREEKLLEGNSMDEIQDKVRELIDSQ